MRREPPIAPLVIAALVHASAAHAYRPFDGTDADVDGEGELELEVGPAYAIHPAGRVYLTLPAMVLNLGVVADWEVIFNANNIVPVGGVDRAKTDYLDDTEALLKAVLRRGSLQDAAGISIATEFGALLPNANGENGVGGVINVIFSQRWRPLALHLNLQGARARDGGYEVLSSLIAEGPADLVVRPVLEIGALRELGAENTFVGLVGAIWTLSGALAVDLAVRGAWPDGATGATDRAASGRRTRHRLLV